MQPITYSLIYNVLLLIAACFAAFWSGDWLLIIVAALISQHTLAHFGDEDGQDGIEEKEPAIGFTADLRG